MSMKIEDEDSMEVGTSVLTENQRLMVNALTRKLLQDIREAIPAEWTSDGQRAGWEALIGADLFGASHGRGGEIAKADGIERAEWVSMSMANAVRSLTHYAALEHMKVCDGCRKRAEAAGIDISMYLGGSDRRSMN